MSDPGAGINVQPSPEHGHQGRSVLAAVRLLGFAAQVLVANRLFVTVQFPMICRASPAAVGSLSRFCINLLLEYAQQFAGVFSGLLAKDSTLDFA